MIPVVLKQEVVGDDFFELAEANDLGVQEQPWHFDYFEEDADSES